MNTAGKTLASIAIAFTGTVANSAQTPSTITSDILITKPELNDADLARLNYFLKPINMGEIKKFEDESILVSSTTKCCASGTASCDPDTWSYEEWMEYCKLPDGPPCP